VDIGTQFPRSAQPPRSARPCNTGVVELTNLSAPRTRAIVAFVIVRPRVRQFVRSAFMVVVFAGMVFALDRILRSYSYADIAAGFRAVTASSVVIAVGLVVAQYALLVVREWLAVGYAGRGDLGVGRTAIAAMIARPLSSLGVSTITGLGLRTRIYGAWGFNGKDLALVTTYNELTYYVGIVATCGVFTVSQVPWPASLTIELPPTWIVGAIGIALAGAYVLWCVRRRRPIQVRSVVIPIPRRGQLIGQVVLPIVDLLIVTGVVHAMLPASTGLSYLELISVVLLANLAGSASQVPAGLGVFETVVLQFAAPEADRSAILGALLVRRVITNLLPMAAGALLLVWFEIRRRPQLRPAWHEDAIATLLSVVTFAAGVIMLVVGAEPRVRTALVPRAPGPFLLIVLGVWLVIVARGLQHRTRRAWRAALVLLALRAIGELAMDARPVIFAILGGEAVLFVACRRVYSEAGSALRPEVASWSAAIVMAIVATAGVVSFSEGHTLTRFAALQLVAIAVAVSIAGGLVGYQIAKHRGDARRAARRAARAAAVAPEATTPTT